MILSNHTCLGQALVKSTCTLTFAIPTLDLLIKGLSKYKALPTISNNGVRNGFLIQCQGNTGNNTQTGTMGVSSSGHKVGVNSCILMSFSSMVILYCVHILL